MAFVYRAERGNVWNPGQTLEQCGPGSYNLRDVDQKSVDFCIHVAPFGSSRIKDTAQPVLKSSKPGPGDYISTQVVDRVNWYKDDIVGVARSAFRSATERLHRDRASYVANPGPGTYSAGPKWGKDSPNRGTSGRSVASSVAFTRRPACPSMPDKFHSYGYDEGPDGTLVAQRPENIRTGVGTDVPGPTDYDPDKKATTRSELATSFAKRSRRSDQLFDVRDTPGPGAYHQESASASSVPMKPTLPRSQGWRGPRQGGAATGSFASGTMRFPDPRPGPGPGWYQTEEGSKRAKGRQPGFGTTDARPYQKDITAMRGAPSYIRNPGPGTYDSRGMKPRKVDAAFRSTSPRFAREKARSPGPGAYDAETAVSLEAQVESRLVSRTGAFGTTDGRFPPRGAVPAGSETPGPAAYHADVPQLMRRYRDRDVQSSSFSTQVDRFRTRDEPVFIRDEATGEEVEYRKPVPGPGTYEAPSSLDRAARRQARGRADDAFLRSSERLPENTTIDGRKLTGDGAHPGPGEYDPSEKISGGHPVSSGTWKGGGRFSAHTTPTPGPALAHGTMITPTFNVTYGDRVDGDALGGTM